MPSPGDAGGNGNVAPIEMIAGPKTKLKGSYGTARDRRGNIHVANFSLNSITEYRAGAKGNAKPIGVIKGKKTTLKEPIDIAIQ